MIPIQVPISLDKIHISPFSISRWQDCPPRCPASAIGSYWCRDSTVSRVSTRTGKRTSGDSVTSTPPISGLEMSTCINWPTPLPMRCVLKFVISRFVSSSIAISGPPFFPHVQVQKNPLILSSSIVSEFNTPLPDSHKQMPALDRWTVSKHIWSHFCSNWPQA